MFRGVNGQQGVDVVVINYRGMAGAKLTTGRMYSSASTDDVKEPLLSIYERFRKNSSQKCFVIGFSMGASILTNALAQIDREHNGPLFDGACIVQAPMKIWVCHQTLSTSLGGLYDRVLSRKYTDLMLDQEDALKDEVKKVCGVDLRQQLEEWRRTGNMNFKNVDIVFTSKLYGFKDVDDYYDRASCIHSVPHIKTPTVFINALDDPVIGSDCIDYEVFARNENVAVATTKHGGHLGYMEGLFDQRFWVVEPILMFCNAIAER